MIAGTRRSQRNQGANAMPGKLRVAERRGEFKSEADLLPEATSIRQQ